MAWMPTEEEMEAAYFTKQARKVRGEPCYLIEREDGNFVDHGFTDFTEKANMAWFSCDKKEADERLKFLQFVAGKKLNLTVTEHIFIDN